ncbi:MAG: precorrin-3B synthase [Xanthobacteraceae bacterium]
MSAPVRSPSAVPSRRGVCPGLSRPLPTGDGLLVRILPIGTITLDAFAALCAAARAYGNGIIEITARGSIQVRGLSADSAPRFADAIAALGIATEDGMPILCNPLAGLDAAEIFDATAIAAALRRAVTQQSLAGRLDQKVSVVIDGGAPLNLARVAADIRVRAQLRNAQPLLRLAIGGDERNAFDLGFIAPDDGVEAVSRLLLVLAKQGERARDIIAAEGLACFEDALAFAHRGSVAPRVREGARSIEADSAPRQCSDAIGLHALRDGSSACGIGLAFGHAEAHALEKFADAAAAAGARGLRTAPNRSLLAIGLTIESAMQFSAAAAQLGCVTRADDPRRRVIACAGAPLCASAYIAARAIAPDVAAAAAPYLSEGLTIHVSGCAKGCAHPGAALLTVVGTPGDCALIANGSARDAPFAAAPLHELPNVVADHLRKRRTIGGKIRHV